ncbi:MAG: hypothetical protein MJZ04_03110 [Bacteroidales bacterium]|nr:hypothetical protein [Bacteroidales bacterium]
MINRHSIAACIIACLSFGTLSAQTKPHSYSDDIGLTVGVNVPMYNGIESDATIGLTYGHFHHNGLGFRTGLQFTPSVSNVDNAFGIPLAFAYRTGSRSTQDRYQSGIHGAANSMYWNGYDYGNVSIGNMLTSFLMNLISNVEFTAGITPGYIAGNSSSAGTAYYPGGDYVRDWTERNHRFALSLDAGANLNYSIWRFDIKLMPSFHYLLTNNYTHREIHGNDYATGTKESSQPIRWFFTFSGGLAFRF